MNPSPMGGFMEGIAGGIRGGTQLYMQGKIEKGREKRAEAEQLNARDFAIFTNKDLPEKMRTQRYNAYNKRMKELDPNYEGYEMGESGWKNKALQGHMDSWNKILKNKDLSQTEKSEALSSLDQQMMADPEVDVRRGQSILTQRTNQLKQQRKGRDFAAGTAGMTPGGGGTISPEQRGLLAGSEAGRSIIQERMKPVRAKIPAIPMYEKMDTGDGTTQKFEWNPKTKKHDIPAGEPVKVKEKDPVYRSSGRDIYRMTKEGAIKLVAGSRRHDAVQSAMQELGWFGATEADQLKMVERHERYHTGTTKPSGKDTKDYGPSTQPEGTTASDNAGVVIITKDGRWVIQ